ncbi:MAG: hypothetical protein HKN56_01455 [Gammaproteobacteria bacterium]|nr:hypothetical protein [Gammaproteobacteria bacterium]
MLLTLWISSWALAEPSVDFIIKSNDVNDDGIVEYAFFPRERHTSNLFSATPAGAIVYTVNNPTEFREFAVEGYCVEKTIVDPACWERRGERLIPRPTDQYGRINDDCVPPGNWDTFNYERCPLTGDDRWRFADPTLGFNERDGWRDVSADFDVMTGNFGNSGGADYLVRSRVPDTPSFLFRDTVIESDLLGTFQTASQEKCNQGLRWYLGRYVNCDRHCSFDKSVCLGQGVATISNLSHGVDLGDPGVSVRVIDYHNDGTDDIEIYIDDILFTRIVFLPPCQSVCQRPNRTTGGGYIDSDLLEYRKNAFFANVETGSSVEALALATPSFREKYGAIFQSTNISELTENWSEPTLIDMNEQTAVYVVNQNENGIQFLYTIVFAWDPEHGWLIHDM